MQSLFLIPFIALLTIIPMITVVKAAATYNILSYGVHPDGKTDASKSLLSVWNEACNSPHSSIINIPKGRYLIGQPVVLSGSNCKGDRNKKSIFIRIDGSLIAPSNYKSLERYYDSKVGSALISFRHVSGVTISGGVIDGKGKSLWVCKGEDGKGAGCPKGVTSLEFVNSDRIIVSRLISMNCQLYHIVILGCKDVTMKGIKLLTPDNSPNTDGIHVQHSNNIRIIGSKLSTGDDCVSIGPGTIDLNIEKVVCGPGHGISIGSLAKDVDEDGVEGITVKDVIFVGTDNGVRIKSWGRHSKGYVKNIMFKHIQMINVRNPIIIDQNYCPHNINCPTQPSGIKISNVTYEDIHGTSATEVAVNLSCSSKNSCSSIKMKDIVLTYKKQGGPEAMASCSNAGVSHSGVVKPKSTCT